VVVVLVVAAVTAAAAGRRGMRYDDLDLKERAARVSRAGGLRVFL